MITEPFVIRFILIVMLFMILLNSYNVYKLNTKHLTTINLSDLEEMKDLHPLIKELYKLTIVNGFFPLANKLINDFIIVNKIDKWIEYNRADLLELIDLLTLSAEKEAIKHANLKLDSTIKKNMYDIDLKQIITDLKKELKVE
jgi:hypothetical protein